MASICRRALLSLGIVFNVSAIEAAPSSYDASTPPSRFNQLGPWTISAGFPNGGSLWGMPALGIRTELTEGEFLSVGLQIAANREEKSESLAFLTKWQHMMFTPAGRSYPFFFMQMGAQSYKTAELSKTQTAFLSAFGIGIEVSLLREISTSIETGFGGHFYPVSQLSYSAATTQIALHYHFQN